MRIKGKDIYVGCYETIEEAIKAREKFKELAGHFYKS